MLPFVQTALQYARKTAIIAGHNEFSYGQLLEAARSFAGQLLVDRTDLEEARVAYLVAPGFDYVRVQWGIWLAGGIAVPLCIDHPLTALRYTLTDAQVNMVVASEEHAENIKLVAETLGIEFRQLHKPAHAIPQDRDLPQIGPDRRAMILYTSGTTNQPKGVVTTHLNLWTQIGVLQQFWQWSEEDHILCVLPLHHVHGIINVVNCALWSGAICEFLPTFSPEAVFEIFLLAQVNVFMAVPTIYYKLIAYYDAQDADRQRAISACLHPFRLMVSGSAALPVSVMERWETISRHRLLERYGMTEIGMALSNAYRGIRYPAHVGRPLPGVHVRLRTEADEAPDTGEPAEIQVRGDSVFLEYWNKPAATAESFTIDGWFKTGDIAVLDPEKGYRILGRNSVDIIKSGGYKISALEIEEVLRQHPALSDCAVVGVPNEEWGEVVGAALIPHGDQVDLEVIQLWLKDFLPGYKIPRQYILLDTLPRNAMGKVTKKAVVQLFQSGY